MNFWVPHELRNCDAPDDTEAEAPSPAYSLDLSSRVRDYTPG